MAKSEAMTIFRKVREQLHVNVVMEDGVRKTGENYKSPPRSESFSPVVLSLGNSDL
jgi:hypothetical protein